MTIDAVLLALIGPALTGLGLWHLMVRDRKADADAIRRECEERWRECEERLRAHEQLAEERDRAQDKALYELQGDYKAMKVGWDTIMVNMGKVTRR